MPKFKRKPITVEAMQFTDADKDRVFRWASELQQNVYPSRDKEGQPTLFIPTLKGEIICSIGDWIIKEPFPTDWRKVYSCKDEIFKQTYDLVNEE